MSLRVHPTRVSVPLTAALLLLSPLAPCLAQSRPLHPPHKHEAREEVASYEQQWRNAQLTSDAASMDKLLSDDFLGILSSGEVVTKAQMLDRMRTRQLRITQLDISDVKIKLIGQIAIVTSLATIQGTSDSHPLDGSFRYTHVFQRLPSGLWKITSFEATHIRGPHLPSAAQTGGQTGSQSNSTANSQGNQ